MDFISHLPEPVLHNILHRLSLKESTRTCILSKAWNCIESRTPFMRFYEVYFPSPTYMLNYAEKRVEHFSQNKDNLAISSFGFRFTLGSDYNHRIVSLLKHVMTKGVKLLELHIRGCNLPPFVLQSESLISLNLYGCKCDPHAQICLPKLTNLDLFDVNMDNHFVERLTHGCPSLLCLEIEYCELTSLRVTCHDMLQSVKVIKCRNLSKVEIVSPNLIAIKYVGDSKSKPCELKLAPSKELTLESVTVKSCWLGQQVSMCETLTLNDIVCVDDAIVISSSNMRNLNIFYCHNMKNVARIDCPNLQSLVYVSNQLPFCSACEFKSLRDIKIDFQIKDHLHTVWYDHLRDLYKKFGSVKELIKQVLSYKRSKDLIILDGFSEFMIPEPVDIKELKSRERVIVSSISNYWQMKDLVDYICKSMACYKRNLYVVSSDCSNSNFSHDLFDKLLKISDESKRRCQGPGGKFQRHYFTSASKCSTNGTFPTVLRSEQFDQCQITTIMLEFSWT